MATAVKVTQVERTKLDWLMIEDDDGKEWKYVKGADAPNAKTIHVTHRPLGDGGFQALIARNEKGEAVLRQDEAGLPDTIIVDYATGGGVGPAVPVLSWWAGPVEYRKVQPAS